MGDRLIHSRRIKLSKKIKTPLPCRSSDGQHNPFHETFYDIDRVWPLLIVVSQALVKCCFEKRRFTGMTAVGVALVEKAKSLNQQRSSRNMLHLDEISFCPIAYIYMMTNTIHGKTKIY